MDVKIKDKDIVLNSNGDACYIDGLNEVLQRIKVACSIKKGSFVYDTSLGAMTQQIDFDDTLLKEKLQMIFMEATIDIGCEFIEVLNVDKNSKTATLKVYCKDLSDTVEVQL